MKKIANSNIKAPASSGVSLQGLMNYANRKAAKDTYKQLSGSLPAVKGRPRTATTHTGFQSVQRALQKKK